MKPVDLTAVSNWLRVNPGGKYQPSAIPQLADAIGAGLAEDELDELVRLAATLEGAWKSPDPLECLLLYLLAKQAGGPVLELGCWRGRSTAFLALGVGKVVSVDWFLGDSTGGEDPSLAAAVHSFLNERLSVCILVADMLALDWSFASGFKMVFYDADHQTNPTVQVMTKLLPLLAPGATVVFHDASWAVVSNAIVELEKQGLLKHEVTLPIWEGFAVCQRTP